MFDPKIYIDNFQQHMAMDRRHVDYLLFVLSHGNFCQCLEIGCHMGYSTTAFLAAAESGAIFDLSLCDIHFTDNVLKLSSMMRAHGMNVSELQKPSTEIISWQYDFIVVDGDHSLENCRREFALLDKIRPTLFLHDTNSAKMGIPNCEGPSYMLEMARDWGRHHIIEDKKRRDGELTDRGMALITTDKALADRFAEYISRE
jgi:hypothetical protein